MMERIDQRIGRRGNLFPFGKRDWLTPIFVTVTQRTGWGPFTKYQEMECDACEVSVMKWRNQETKTAKHTCGGEVSIQLAVDNIHASGPATLGFDDSRVKLPLHAATLRSVAQRLEEIASELENSEPDRKAG